jgi:hypothetical protein
VTVVARSLLTESKLASPPSAMAVLILNMPVSTPESRLTLAGFRPPCPIIHKNNWLLTLSLYWF